MLKIVENIVIDERALIPCPLVGFRARRVHKACPGCEHYKGLAEMSAAGEWNDKYVVRCAAVIERRTHIIDIVDE